MPGFQELARAQGQGNFKSTFVSVSSDRLPRQPVLHKLLEDMGLSFLTGLKRDVDPALEHGQKYLTKWAELEQTLMILAEGMFGANGLIYSHAFDILHPLAFMTPGAGKGYEGLFARRTSDALKVLGVQVAGTRLITINPMFQSAMRLTPDLEFSQL
jgi:hypothetical protein